jgi:2'-5' RNA ligase
MTQIRTFVEIPIPDTRPLQPLLDDLGRIDNVRVSPTSQLHITLAFIGDVDERKVPSIVESMTSVLDGFGPFTVSVGSIGRFPNRGRANIVWVGAEPHDRLTELADLVRKSLDKVRVGYDDKPFKPHITIGRCKGPTDVDGFIENNDKCLLSFECSAARLMKSELSPKGARHSVLARIPL